MKKGIRAVIQLKDVDKLSQNDRARVALWLMEKAISLREGKYNAMGGVTTLELQEPQPVRTELCFPGDKPLVMRPGPVKKAKTKRGDK